jgi:hypothetical protein
MVACDYRSRGTIWYKQRQFDSFASWISGLPLGTWERCMEMERAALQERAGGKMARALGHPVEEEDLGGAEAHRPGLTRSLQGGKRSSIEWRYR